MTKATHAEPFPGDPKVTPELVHEHGLNDTEYAADRFAAALLMPKLAVLHAFAVRRWDIPTCEPEQVLTISGVLGVYMLLYPQNRILTLILIFLVPLPAFVILGYWFLIQFAAGVSSFGAAATGGVAWWAHIGGFLTGLLITAAVRRKT